MLCHTLVTLLAIMIYFIYKCTISPHYTSWFFFTWFHWLFTFCFQSCIVFSRCCAVLWNSFSFSLVLVFLMALLALSVIGTETLHFLDVVDSSEDVSIFLSSKYSLPLVDRAKVSPASSLDITFCTEKNACQSLFI